MIVQGWIELRQAENAIMQKYGVSRAYVQAIMAANRAYLHGQLSISQWGWKIRRIQSHFPEDFASVGDIGVTWIGSDRA